MPPSENRTERIWLADFRGDCERVFAFDWTGIDPPNPQNRFSARGAKQDWLFESTRQPGLATVVGADVTRGRWAVVVVQNGRVERAFVAANMDELAQQVPRDVVIAVDIPIGLASSARGWPRPCDPAARAFVGPRRNSVFIAPPRPVLNASGYAEANELHRQLTGKGLAQQSWALRAKILEVEQFITRNPDLVVIEVHPEVSFCALNGGPLAHPKKGPEGEATRRDLLAGAGIEPLDDLPRAMAKIPHDDILDAAVAAWSAQHFARGQAEILGAPSPRAGAGLRGVIWY
jgi:predicted RNase H-like nuclease